MDFDRENPFPLARLLGTEDTNWHDCSPELETAYLQQLAGVERLEEATSLQLVVNTAGGGSVAHLGATLPNLVELNLNGSTIDSLRDLGTGFRLLQVLWVSRCGLKALDGLNGLPSLRELYAAYNDITDLQPVDSCQHLEILDVECNCIPDTDAVLYLVSCSNLQTLTLAGNPAAEKQGYRQYVCGVLPSLQSLDDEPVTSTDCNPHHQKQQTGGYVGSRRGVGGSGTDGAGLKRSSIAGLPLPPPPLRAAAAPGRCSLDADESSTSGCRGGGVVATAATPDAEEVAFVVAGIKHARVGVDSHEFREIEMNLLVATADGTDVQLDVRPGTSTLLPASASTWVRTLRSSREGSLAALRASTAAAAASAVARTGSQSPTSPCSASPISSRPPSSQQQQTSGQFSATAVATPTERWAVPAGPGAGPTNYGGSGGIPAGLGPWRPGSGAGILTSSGGGVGGGLGGTMEGTMRPGSGGYRPGTGRPYSARPGTSASFSARLGTSASTGAAPSSTSVGLYWAKNRISGTSAAATGSGANGDGAAVDADSTAYSSKLTLGSDTTFGGSFARDLRKWKGAAVRAAAAASAGGAGVNDTAAATLGGGNGLSSTLLRGGQLDPKALLEELKRWKLETADKVLFVDPDEAASSDGWTTADTPDRATVLGGGGVVATATAASQADILRLTSSSQDGVSPELTAAFGVRLGMALLDSQSGDSTAAGAGFSPMVPGSPLQPPRPPPGTAAAGRRKMVLAKVLRDIAADTIGNSGVCISDIIAGLRPVHAPQKNGSAGGTHTPCVAWGAPESSSSRGGGERERDKSGGRASAAGTLTTGQNHHNNHLQNNKYHNHHQHHHHHHHQHPKSPHSQQQQQQGGGQRPSSARSVCSSSGHSDNGTSGAGTQSSRPGSRDEATSSGGAAVGSGGGAPLQRQRSASRAPGLPTGPSAPASTAALRGVSAVGEVDVRLSNPSPVSRVSGW
ncbi:hypothetical protein Vafri_10998 [Volvox africanus]|uniref:Leucine-rich repeat-containing protein 56 n=1 Tax=Volvox africanus TaxID=51714 RepID=A0A8J4F059_9CHLO|nr:hypothetical protein Vafri_10998 [Volvox africanus]